VARFEQVAVHAHSQQRVGIEAFARGRLRANGIGSGGPPRCRGRAGEEHLDGTGLDPRPFQHDRSGTPVHSAWPIAPAPQGTPWTCGDRKDRPLPATFHGGKDRPFRQRGQLVPRPLAPLPHTAFHPSRQAFRSMAGSSK